MSPTGVWVGVRSSVVPRLVECSSGGAPFLGRGGRGGVLPGSCHLLGDRLDQQVGDEADGQQADHDEQRRPVVAGDQLTGRAAGVEDAVDDQRPGDAGGRPGGQQPAVDRADLEGAEQVAQVGRDGGEPAAVEAMMITAARRTKIQVAVLPMVARTT